MGHDRPTHPEQRFSIGYHLNSWDLGGLELEPGLRFLAGEGFGWFEALARDGFSNDFARRFMRAGEDPTQPTGNTTPEMAAANKKAREQGFTRLIALIKEMKSAPMASNATHNKTVVAKKSTATAVSCHDEKATSTTTEMAAIM